MSLAFLGMRREPLRVLCRGTGICLASNPSPQAAVPRIHYRGRRWQQKMG